MPSQIAYPLWGQGKLGVSFLVGQSLRGVWPIGFPQSSGPPLEAHGVKISRVGFAVHDNLHRESDPTFDRLVEHIAKRAEEHFIKGGDVESFNALYIPHAVRRHQVLSDYLQHIYADFLSKFLPSEGRTAYAKAMAGWFLVTHEFPSQDPSLYAEHDLVKVIQLLTQEARDAIFADGAHGERT